MTRHEPDAGDLQELPDDEELEELRDLVADSASTPDAIIRDRLTAIHAAARVESYRRSVIKALIALTIYCETGKCRVARVYRQPKALAPPALGGHVGRLLLVIDRAETQELEVASDKYTWARLARRALWLDDAEMAPAMVCDCWAGVSRYLDPDAVVAAARSEVRTASLGTLLA